MTVKDKQSVVVLAVKHMTNPENVWLFKERPILGTKAFVLDCQLHNVEVSDEVAEKVLNAVLDLVKVL